MGNSSNRYQQTSNSSASIQQYWSAPIKQILPEVPGSPFETHSIHNQQLTAQYYSLQQPDSNRDEQIAMYTQRKMGTRNVVNIYDWAIRKRNLECANQTQWTPINRNNSNIGNLGHCCFYQNYQVIVQRIDHRLSDFPEILSSSQIAYIFHQCLNGYSELLHYNRLCYPNSMMIGIKTNAQIKVWINQNWAENNFMKARSQQASITALWNTIRSKASKNANIKDNQIQKINKILFSNNLNTNNRYQSSLTYQIVKGKVRQLLKRQIIDGRFSLQSKIKTIYMSLRQCNTDNTKYSLQSPIRARAYSQQIRKQPAAQPVGQPIFYASRVLHKREHQSMNKPSSIVKNNPINIQQLKYNNLINTKVNMVSNNLIIKQHYRPAVQLNQRKYTINKQVRAVQKDISNVNVVSNERRFNQNLQTSPQIIIQKIKNNDINLTNKKTKANFSYKNSQIIPHQLERSHEHVDRPLEGNPNNIKIFSQSQRQPSEIKYEMNNISLNRYYNINKQDSPMYVKQTQSQIKYVDSNPNNACKNIQYCQQNTTKINQNIPKIVPQITINDKNIVVSKIDTQTSAKHDINLANLDSIKFANKQSEPFTNRSTIPYSYDYSPQANNANHFTKRNQTKSSQINSSSNYVIRNVSEEASHQYKYYSPENKKYSQFQKNTQFKNQGERNNIQFSQTLNLNTQSLDEYKNESVKSQQQSQTKKVAQEFKYYLRSIQRFNQNQSSPNSFTNQQQKGKDEFQYEPASNINNQRFKIKHLYETENGAILERWDEEESLSQNL